MNRQGRERQRVETDDPTQGDTALSAPSSSSSPSPRGIGRGVVEELAMATLEEVRFDLLDDPVALRDLLAYVSCVVDDSSATVDKIHSLIQLSIGIQPHQLKAEVKVYFVQKAIEKGVVESVVRMIETGGIDLVEAACDFLGDFVFNSDAGGHAVLEALSRIVSRFMSPREAPMRRQLAAVRSFTALCANIVGICRTGHLQLLPLVQPIFLPMVLEPGASDELLNRIILLLANLSLTMSEELRALRVAEVLLELVLDTRVSATRKSVAESVVIFLLGHQKCQEIDLLMAHNVVEDYCVPILECALKRTEFRGMYPHLIYSARLFQVLATSRDYAAHLAARAEVPELLWLASRLRGAQLRLSSETEGRQMALEALSSLVRFGLWSGPSVSDDAEGMRSEEVGGPSGSSSGQMLGDDDAKVRAAAAGLWARLHVLVVNELLLVGYWFEAKGILPPQLWRNQILAALLPLLGLSPS